MTKKEAKKLLKEHGIKLKFVTPLPFYCHQQDLARKMYGIPDEYIVPTKEQYNRITNIIGEAGLSAIMEERITHEYFNIWSSSETSSSRAWRLYFQSGNLGQVHWDISTKALGSSFIFWEFSKETNS